MQRFRIRLDISPDMMEQYYSGRSTTVFAISEAGVSVQFPARLLRPHMTHDGIHGLFELVTENDYRLRDFRRLT
ncbi:MULTISPECIES: DUF2835 family protein [unclassified Thioalkalivibrio]|uniref:DUF2835 family protein n=1 Tax=unclassified Thioalkalivibrio TaxID=2621013 RepID=UPI0003605283|nr:MULTISPECIES: DUF2835 family protein [unclassified Thioalkalivibrio]PYG03682.1 uncharacterized protein DUF2835 [Thioalkalivibrio sp. ALE21]